MARRVLHGESCLSSVGVHYDRVWRGVVVYVVITLSIVMYLFSGFTHVALDEAQVCCFFSLLNCDQSYGRLLHVCRNNSFCFLYVCMCVCVQAGWDEHWFPYKLGMYGKILLAPPVCVTRLDYQSLIDTGAADAMTNLKFLSTRMTVSRKGKCHCVAVWVDYEVSPGNEITHWTDDSAGDSGGNFPPHLKTNLKFFHVPTSVDARSVTSGVGGRNVNVGDVITCSASVQHTEGGMDFNFDF